MRSCRGDGLAEPCHGRKRSGPPTAHLSLSSWFAILSRRAAITKALNQLSKRPDLLLVDGQGLAHPHRFGLACHLGVLADVPTIGVAKSRLIGTYEEPGIERGAWSPLTDGGETIGAVLRTRRAVRPVFVSVGHRISLRTAIDLVLRCTSQFRLPEPIRAADRLSRHHSCESAVRKPARVI